MDLDEFRLSRDLILTHQIRGVAMLAVDDLPISNSQKQEVMSAIRLAIYSVVGTIRKTAIIVSGGEPCSPQ